MARLPSTSPISPPRFSGFLTTCLVAVPQLLLAVPPFPALLWGAASHLCQSAPHLCLWPCTGQSPLPGTPVPCSTPRSPCSDRLLPSWLQDPHATHLSFAAWGGCMATAWDLAGLTPLCVFFLPQDPTNLDKFNVSNFFHVKNNMKITDPGMNSQGWSECQGLRQSRSVLPGQSPCLPGTRASIRQRQVWNFLS